MRGRLTRKPYCLSFCRAYHIIARIDALRREAGADMALMAFGVGKEARSNSDNVFYRIAL